MLYIFSQGSMKGFQASGEASSHPERIFLSSKLDNSFIFSFTVKRSFLLFQVQFRIQISNPDPHPDLLA
jgi:hypothetical protein